MFQRILVPLDGSSRAEQALPLAAHVAQWSHSSIVLLRSVELMTEKNPPQAVAVLTHAVRRVSCGL
jgi:nucleotide-binding universal stress UspA family protein